MECCQRERERERGEILTCAFLNARSLLQGMAAELAVEIVLPELRKPDISPVVLECAAGEVAIKA